MLESLGVLSTPISSRSAAILNLSGRVHPIAAAVRIREANFAFMADVRSASGKMITASSSTDLIRSISSG
jgi:hypothetical protein